MTLTQSTDTPVSHAPRARLWGARFSTGAAVAVAAIAMAPTLLTASPASASTYLGGVDVQRACNVQYPATWGLQARALNRWDAFSWRCVAPFNNTYGVDMNWACADQYGGGAYTGLRNRWDAFSWYCLR